MNFQTNDWVIVTGNEAENENVGRSARLVAYIQPGDTIFYEDGYWHGGDTGAWIIHAEDLVRKTRYRGDIISYLAQVTPDEIRLVGEDHPAKKTDANHPIFNPSSRKVSQVGKSRAY